MGMPDDETRGTRRRPRVAIIGAGPIGLECAVQASLAGLAFDVYEAGAVGEYVQQWGHVVLFTPFEMNRSDTSLALLCGAEPAGSGRAGQGVRGTRSAPLDDAFLTGREYVERYLRPLAQTAALQPYVHERHRVVSVGRSGVLKGQFIGDARRAERPFRLLIEADGTERSVEADIVIDASGTYGTHNWLGSGGIPAEGERVAGDRVRYTLDDILGADRPLYAGRRVVQIGAGYSAATSVVALSRLCDVEPQTMVYWLTCSDRTPPVRSVPNDPLFARGQLVHRANKLAQGEHPRVRHLPGVTVQRLECTAAGVVVHAVEAGGRRHVLEVDRVLANVGYQPDRTLYQELQVHECYATSGPMKLAAALMAEQGADCLERTAVAADLLRNPEPNFYILGAKSYGRDPSFLMQMGLAQVDQLFRELILPARVASLGRGGRAERKSCS